MKQLFEAGQQGHKLLVRLHDPNLLDAEVLYQMDADLSALPCRLQDLAGGLLEYDTTGWISLKTFLSHCFLEQEEGFLFVTELLEEALALSQSRPVWLSLDSVFVSRLGDAFRFVVVPLPLHAWMVQKEEQKEFLLELARSIKTESCFEVSGIILSQIDQEDFSFPSLITLLQTLRYCYYPRRAFSFQKRKEQFVLKEPITAPNIEFSTFGFANRPAEGYGAEKFEKNSNFSTDSPFPFVKENGPWHEPAGAYPNAFAEGSAGYFDKADGADPFGNPSFETGRSYQSPFESQPESGGFEPLGQMFEQTGQGMNSPYFAGNPYSQAFAAEMGRMVDHSWPGEPGKEALNYTSQPAAFEKSEPQFQNQWEQNQASNKEASIRKEPFPQKDSIQSSGSARSEPLPEIPSGPFAVFQQEDPNASPIRMGHLNRSRSGEPEIRIPGVPKQQQEYAASSPDSFNEPWTAPSAGTVQPKLFEDGQDMETVMLRQKESSGARLWIENTSHSLNFDSVCIGRHASNHIVLSNPAVSGFHARIWRDEGSFYLEDLNSSNGTRICGKPVSGRVLLQDGMEIVFGKVKGIFYV